MSPMELKQWRMRRNLSQRALADLLSVGPGTVKKWERAAYPIPDSVAKLMSALDEIDRLKKD